jgi:hypothetical protein
LRNFIPAGLFIWNFFGENAPPDSIPVEAISVLLFPKSPTAEFQYNE